MWQELSSVIEEENIIFNHACMINDVKSIRVILNKVHMMVIPKWKYKGYTLM